MFIIIISIIIIIIIITTIWGLGGGERGDDDLGHHLRPVPVCAHVTRNNDHPNSKNDNSNNNIQHYNTNNSNTNLRTNIIDFKGLDSSIILILRGGMLVSIEDFLGSLSQTILVGIILVGRLGVRRSAARDP